MFEVMKRRNDVRAYALVADHTPKHDEEKHWTRFLNQDTAFFVGADKIAKILKAPVIYVAMRRDGPGHYSVELTLLAEPPYDRDSGPEIVERYARMLEQEIRRSPADWLWLHRKWKYKQAALRVTDRRSVGPATYQARASACRSRQERRHRAHRRILEEIGDLEVAGIRRLDLLVDLRERERARAELEQVVVGRQRAVGQRGLADREQRLLEVARARRARRRRAGVVARELRAARRRNGPPRSRARARSAGSCRSSSSETAAPESRRRPASPMRSLTTRRTVRAVSRERGEVVALVQHEHEHVVGGRVRRDACPRPPRGRARYPRAARGRARCPADNGSARRRTGSP